LYIYDLASGKRLERLADDFVGSMDVSGRRTNQKEVFVTQTGFTTPLTVSKYDLSRPEGQRTLDVWRTTVLKGLKTDEFSAEQVRAESSSLGGFADESGLGLV
jgi:prolyl oligopeptidase